MKLKMPISLDNMYRYNQNCKTCVIMQKNLIFFPKIYFQPSYTHRNQKYLYMHWVLYGMKKLCHAFLYTWILLT